jgi:hypothetical protein
VLAFGEAKLLAGWEDDAFAVDWHIQFKADQKDAFPHILSEYIMINMPIVKEIVDGFNVLEVDALHSADIGMQVCHHEPSPISAEEMLGANPQDESADISSWIAEWCNGEARVFMPEDGGQPEDEHDGFAD